MLLDETCETEYLRRKRVGERKQTNKQTNQLNTEPRNYPPGTTEQRRAKGLGSAMVNTYESWNKIPNRLT